MCPFTHRSQRANNPEKFPTYGDPRMENPRSADLTPADRAVLAVLVDQAGRVTGRETLARMAGLDGAGARRPDVSLVALRRALGAGSIITVRQRGWMLSDGSLPPAREILGLSPD